MFGWMAGGGGGGGGGGGLMNGWMEWIGQMNGWVYPMHAELCLVYGLFAGQSC